MGNASNSKFAISRLAQSNKDTESVSELVRYPIKYGSGFVVQPEVDTYGDMVENTFESSNTDILGATVAGSVAMASHPDFIALGLASILGTISSTSVASGQTFTAVAGTDICTAAGHGLSNGQRVKFSSTTTLPDPLASGTIYFVGTLTSDTFKVYTTYANAITETSAVDITDTGTGTHTMTPESYKHTITPSSATDPNFHTILHDDGTVSRKVIGAVFTALGFGCDFEQKRMDVAADFTAIRREFNDDTLTADFTAATTDICTSVGHGLITGRPVRLTTTGTLPAGLATATTYYVRKLTDDTFKLYTTFEAAAADGTAVNITDTGTGTHTFTGYEVAYPVQEKINAFHFTRGGAELLITIDDGTEATYTSTWAGFSYQLGSAIDAEQRAGSNTFRVIEKADRGQSLTLMMDYDDATFCDLIQEYQTEGSPKKLKVVLTLRGKLIGQTDYFKIRGTFYNCHLGDHGYSQDPSIGKQTLSLAVNNDLAEGKSVQWEVWNDIDGYLS